MRRASARRTIATDGVTVVGPAVLSDSPPSAIGTVSPGASTEVSRADHIHAHGDQLGGTLHALATSSLDGFMAAVDKARLDITPVAYITYQAGGTSGGGIVTTWAEVDAFAVAAQSPWVLFIDNSLGQCDVPATADTDFRNLMTIRHSGADGGNALIARDGCILRNPGQIGTNSHILCESLTVTPVRLETPNTVIIFREGGFIGLADVSGVPTVPAISVTNGQQILAFLEGGQLGTESGGAAAVPVIDFSVVGAFHIIFQLVNSRGGNGIIDNVIQADPTTTFINGHDQTANLGDQSAFFAGTFIDNPIGFSKWMSWESGDTASTPATAQVGRLYFDTDLKTTKAFDATVWQAFSRKEAYLVGDGVATTYNIAHSLSTRDVQVEVYANASPWDTVLCDVERPDADTVRLSFLVAPAADEFRVVIIG